MPAPVGRLDRDDDMVVVMGLGRCWEVNIGLDAEHFIFKACSLVNQKLDRVRRGVVSRSGVAFRVWIVDRCVQKTDPPDLFPNVLRKSFAVFHCNMSA